MTNVSIILTEDNPSKFPDKQVIDQIKKASGSRWTHAQILIDGVLYESSIHGGFKKTEDYEFWQRVNNKQVPLHRDLTVSERAILKGWWSNKIWHKIKYSVLKLLAYVCLYKTRDFWKMINYYPMSYDKVWGDFCSAAVANSLKYLAIAVNDPDLDPNPDINGEVFTPGDFDK